MKKIISILLVFIVASFCVSCSFSKAYEGKPKDFTTEELTITLTDEFMKMSTFAAGFTAAYGASDVTLLISKETFADLGIDDSYSAVDYAWAVHDSYTLDDLTDVYTTEDGLVCFEYSATGDEGNVFKYFAVCYKSADAFWLLQFATDEPFYDTYLPYFISWAKTVTFAD